MKRRTSICAIRLLTAAVLCTSVCAADFVLEPAKRVPVVYNVDVAIAGGGLSGVFAAIAAARNGAETVVIERFGSLGGSSGPGLNTGGGRQAPGPYDPQAPLELADSVTLVAHVSKGTYIRSLARDIARALGTLGHVTYLRRIKAGPFREEQAISLDKLEEIAKGAAIENLLLPLEAGLDDIPVLTLDPDSAQAVRQGRVLSELPHTDGLHLASLHDVPVALVEVDGGTAKVVRGFNLPDVAE